MQRTLGRSNTSQGTPFISRNHSYQSYSMNEIIQFFQDIRKGRNIQLSLSRAKGGGRGAAYHAYFAYQLQYLIETKYGIYNSMVVSTWCTLGQSNMNQRLPFIPCILRIPFIPLKHSTLHYFVQIVINVEIYYVLSKEMAQGGTTPTLLTTKIRLRHISHNVVYYLYFAPYFSYTCTSNYHSE